MAGQNFDGEVTKAVVDAGVLFDMLIINYAGKTSRHHGIENLLEKLSQYLRKNPRAREEFLQFTHHITTFWITSHVVGELKGLVSSRLKLHGEKFKDFWSSTLCFFREKKIKEELIQLVNMQEASLDKIGPVDLGLAMLAHQKGVVLLTNDRLLAKYAWDQGMKCKTMEQILWI